MAVRELVAEAPLKIVTGIEPPILLRVRKSRTPAERVIIKAMMPLAMTHNWIDEVRKDEDQEKAIASLIGVVMSTVTSCGVPDYETAIYAKHLMDSSERVLRRQYSS